MNIPNGNKTLSDWSSSLENSKVRSSNFDTLSGHPLDVCYFPEDFDQNFINDIGAPGQYPTLAAFTLIYIEGNYGQ